MGEQRSNILAERRYAPYIGQRFEALRLLRISRYRGDNRRVYGVFECDCGSVARRALGRVVNGKTPGHCGCKTNRSANVKHGMQGSSEYRVWQAVKRRCLCETDKDYPRYGGSGIGMHGPWQELFEEFYAHIGPRPDGTTIDRIDNRKGYVPGNVRWATLSQQSCNRSTSMKWFIKGREYIRLSDAAADNEVSVHTVWRWVNGQYDTRRDSFTPPRGDCYAKRVY